MARAILMVLWAALSLGGCAEAPFIEADAPLLVFNSYPANGATVDRPDLTELAFTFSQELGAAEHARQQAGRFFVLEGPDGVVELIRDDATNVAYEPDGFTIRVVVPHALRSTLPVGQYRATMHTGLATEAGLGLPTDFVVRFRLADLNW